LRLAGKRAVIYNIKIKAHKRSHRRAAGARRSKADTSSIPNTYAKILQFPSDKTVVLPSYTANFGPYPYAVGHSTEKDKAVQELATRLNDEFDHDIMIRFNTNQLSGGAWLKDNNRSSQVGLGVNLKPPEWYLEQRHEWLFDDGEELDRCEFSVTERQLVIEVKADVPVVDEEHANHMTDRDDRTSYAVVEFDEIDEAWNWFVEHINRDAINPPE
jgi:hypothetical protein